MIYFGKKKVSQSLENNKLILLTFAVEMDQRASVVGSDVAFVNGAASVNANLRSFGLRCTHDRPAKKETYRISREILKLGLERMKIVR